MASLFGPVLTNATSAPAFLDYYRAGRFSAAKVITGWGIDGGWTQEARRAVVQAVPKLMVRTVAGDPSYQNGRYPWLYPTLVIEELRPWVEARPDLWVELGNEPDARGWTEHDVWHYRWYLLESIRAIRADFPRVRIVSPAVMVGVDRWHRWYEVMYEAINACDSVGVHLYAYHRLLCREDEDTGQYVKALRLMLQLFPQKTIAVTELGIHDPATPKEVKLARYREFARLAPPRWTWSLFYHLCQDQAVQPEYDIPASSLVAS